VANDYPEIRDISTLTGVFNLDQYLVMGIEGQKDAAGSQTIAVPVFVTSGQQSDALFGPVSSLSGLVKFCLNQGMNGVWAVASASGTLSTLVQRQAAWATLEDNPDVRIRLTDSVVQADLVALADSCEYAEAIQNKQFCFVGLATPTTLVNMTAAATAITSKRAVLVGPGYYDENGALQNGSRAAARVACEVARNPDITDDLDTLALAGTTGIEKDVTTQMPVFRLRANGGTPINDFQTLLSGGVSPLRAGRAGQAEITHLRTTFTTDTTYDALMTLLIRDETFVGLRSMLEGEKFLRRGNTASNRALCGKLVETWLVAHNDWIEPRTQPNGVLGYGVTVTPSPDLRKMIVDYFGNIVRNNQVIELRGTLTIAA
jgi:phage tail sheath gpL-like